MAYRYKGFEADTVEEIIALRDALDGDDWIEWNGGECPVDGYSTVDLKFRDSTATDDAAGYFDWQHYGTPSDIVAYRVINA